MTTKNNPKFIGWTEQPKWFVTEMSIIKKIVEKLRELLSSLMFPSRCPVCDGILEPEEIQKGIHSICESKIYPVTGSVCMHCGKPLVVMGRQESQKSQEFKSQESQMKQFEYGDGQEFCYDCSRLRQVGTRFVFKQGGVTTLNGMPYSYITQAKSLYIYRGAIKHTMYKFKYSNKRECARFFAQQAVDRLGWWLGCDIIIPVPMYEPKKKARGYNQAESFAKELSKLTGIPVDTNIIKRVKDTTPQKELNPQERKNNLKSAFQTQQNSVQYSHALVVDDIYTTGSTAEAVAKELIKTGVRQVYVLTVCIGGDM